MEEIEIIELAATPALIVKATVGTMALGKVMGPAYERIDNVIKASNVSCGSEDFPFCIYRNIDWDNAGKKGFVAMMKMMFFHKWELEMGIPTSEKMSSEQGIESVEMPSGKFLKTIHIGPYMKVGKTYERMQAFAIEQKKELKNFSIERYLNDPKQTPSDQLRTEVLVPIV